MSKYLVVGGSGSIGHKIIEQIISEGHTVLATYNSHLPNVTESESSKVKYVKCNIIDHEFDEIINNQVEHIIYCIGTCCYHDLFSADYDEFQEQCNLQVYAPLDIIRKYMNKNNNLKSIILISSDAGVRPSIESSYYGMAKKLMIVMADILKDKLIHEGIRINTIAPGLTYSDMAVRLCKFRNIDISAEEYKRIDYKLVDTEEISNLCMFLTSDKANHINGQVIEINSALN